MRFGACELGQTIQVKPNRAQGRRSDQGGHSKLLATDHWSSCSKFENDDVQRRSNANLSEIGTKNMKIFYSISKTERSWPKKFYLPDRNRQTDVCLRFPSKPSWHIPVNSTNDRLNGQLTRRRNSNGREGLSPLSDGRKDSSSRLHGSEETRKREK